MDELPRFLSPLTGLGSLLVDLLRTYVLGYIRRPSGAGVRWFVLRASPMRNRGNDEIKDPTLSQKTREGWGTPFGYGFAWG